MSSTISSRDHVRVLPDPLVNQIAAGEVIGTVGETGSLAGPQLYFEIRKGGEALDPGDWIRLPGAG